MTRARRVQILISLAVVAVIAVAIAVALGAGGDEGPTNTLPEAAPEAAGLFEGIPADGFELGSPDAEATLEEFIDPQCPFCAQFSNDVLPRVIEDYVKPGRVRLVLRPLAFLGEDSVRAARALAAAADQDKAWPLMEAIFANQGPENSGYMTDQFLRDLAGRIEGLDAAAVVAAASAEDSAPSLAEAEARSNEFGIDSTPSFLLTVAAGRPRVLESNLDADAFTAALEQRLAQ